jgi:hypothetical protein
MKEEPLSNSLISGTASSWGGYTDDLSTLIGVKNPTPYTICPSNGITSNLNNMKTKQVKAAIFTIERNDKNEVISSKFVKELWVEVKNGVSLDLVVAKELKGDFDPETTVVKELSSVTF